jgi:hypothetical protein
MNEKVSARRAIEALRAGVPNRDAVSSLGCSCQEVLAMFDERLEDLRESVLQNRQTHGMLVAAEFGGGKSHVLEYLSHRARAQNFAVSKVVISKETQLFDSLKIFRAAVDNLVLENVVGDALREIAVDRDRLSRKRPAYREFELWLRDSSLNSRFEATVWLYNEAAADSDVQDRLVSFWEGGSIEVTYLRRKLREASGLKLFPLEKIAAKELARQRFVFMARLLRAAGYHGWVILLDELELIGRYTVLQRGRAYAELAQLLGLTDVPIPGLLTVGAITPDYPSAILGDKDDRNQIGFRFRARGDLESGLTAALAESAMNEIEQKLLRIREPARDDLPKVLDTLARVYATAYGFEPAQPSIDEYWAGDKSMRQYVRSWITTWDLNRIAPSYQPNIEVEPVTDDYSEDELLEKPTEDGGEEEPGWGGER